MRIRHFVQERMRLLASISHDLRTPIARLRLQLENEPALQRPELVFDALDDLQHLAEDAIALARTGANSEPERKTDLVALLESMVADYEEYDNQIDCLQDDPQCRVRLHNPAPAHCMLRPAAFRRCLENLVDNALEYGHRADIYLDTPAPNLARIRIEDHGPGIPPEELENIFLPFYRLDSSRSKRTGGTGLGLSIARDLARLNHTAIVLSNLPGGGLCADMLIPMDPRPHA